MIESQQELVEFLPSQLRLLTHSYQLSVLLRIVVTDSSLLSTHLHSFQRYQFHSLSQIDFSLLLRYGKCDVAHLQSTVLYLPYALRSEERRVGRESMTQCV